MNENAVAVMRAKLRCFSVKQVMGSTIQAPIENKVESEELEFTAVGRSGGYGNDGIDEDNTYARWTPSATFKLTCRNPELWGKFRVGRVYYVDFIEAK